jgi:adenylylsulfate kinase-like enzyme
MATDPQAVLITGAYGVGKSSVVVEMADIVERRGWRYAALDLDWLGWGSSGGEGEASEDQLTFENLALVVANYRRRGNDRFLLAHAVRHANQLDLLREAIAMPLRVVRLTLPLEEIRRRAAPDPTMGRAYDLERTEAWLAAGEEPEIADLVVTNDRPIDAVANEILDWLDWD